MVAVGKAGRHDAHALVKQLAGVRPVIRRVAKSRINPRIPMPRVDVVSESLCDDVISYLAPTLEKHKGCTLVDLQPGACLFSSKLHDFLQPKWHLLIEPDDHYYQPFIKPLLDRPGSTYRYTQLNIHHQSSYWHEFSRILRDPKLLPSRKPLPQGDPNRRRLDPNVLIIGNLARETRAKTGTHSVPQAPMLLREFSLHALANQFFHEAGLVRMLFWLPEKFKPDIFSLVPWTRNGFNVALDMGLHMSEVASVQSTEAVYQSRSKVYARRTRSKELVASNARRVAETMREAGMVVPAGRESQVASRDIAPSSKRANLLSPLQRIAPTSTALRKTIEQTRTRLHELWPAARAKHQTKAVSLTYPQVHSAVDEYGQGLPGNKLNWWRSKILIDIGLSMINIEAGFKAIEESIKSSPELDDLRNDIHALDSEFVDICGKVAVRTRSCVSDLLEDQIAFFQNPPLLNVDQRAYEPLQAQTSEFWPPQNNLALFDFVPKSRDLSVPDLASTDEIVRFCADFVQEIMSHKTRSLPRALDVVGVNAAKDLIPMVPAITDPRKGGRLNPHSLRGRMVTAEMLEGLIKTYFEWPFRPVSWELALAESAGGHGEAEADEAEVDEKTESS